MIDGLCFRVIDRKPDEGEILIPIRATKSLRFAQTAAKSPPRSIRPDQAQLRLPFDLDPAGSGSVETDLPGRR